MTLKIDCVSDLHGFFPELPGGDLLIVAGDLTKSDRWDEYLKFFGWLSSQKYRQIVFISGNHDNLAMSQFDWGGDNITYLLDSGTEFEGFKIFGSPWTKRFEGENPHCLAFTCDTEEELAEKWKCIPEDTDILVTHSPPKGMLDLTPSKENVGSKTLWEAVQRVKPRIHIFGHIHACCHKYFEIKWPLNLQQTGESSLQCEYYVTYCVNSSHVNERYEPVNKPVRIIL